jgi:hypothetical protein
VQFSPAPVTSSLLGPNTLPSTLFSKTINLCSSNSVRDQVSQLYKNGYTNFHIFG